MSVNAALVRQVADYIRLHEDQWSQTDYESGTLNQKRCGTTRCFAGWAVAITHPEVKSIFNLSFITRANKLQELGILSADEADRWYRYTYLYHPSFITHEYAMLLLGLSYSQADRIFYETHPASLNSFLEMVQEVTSVDLALSSPVAPLGTVVGSGEVSIQSTEPVRDNSGGTALPELHDSPE